jgi:hypothetical protein
MSLRAPVLTLCLLISAVAALSYSCRAFADDQFKFIGEYSAFKSTAGPDCQGECADESCTGYFIDLWESQTALIGYVGRFNNLCYDPPRGVLQNVVYDKKSGSLKFTARYGYSQEGDKPESYCAQIDFAGVIKGKLIRATISEDGRKETVDLKKEKQDQDGTAERDFPDYEQWKKYYSYVYKCEG